VKFWEVRNLTTDLYNLVRPRVNSLLCDANTLVSENRHTGFFLAERLCLQCMPRPTLHHSQKRVKIHVTQLSASITDHFCIGRNRKLRQGQQV